MSILFFMCSDIDSCQGLNFCRVLICFLSCLLGESPCSSPIEAEDAHCVLLDFLFPVVKKLCQAGRQMHQLLGDVDTHWSRAPGSSGPSAELKMYGFASSTSLQLAGH